MVLNVTFNIGRNNEFIGSYQEASTHQRKGYVEDIRQML